MKTHRLLFQFDFLLFSGAVLLSLMGLLGIYSATAAGEGNLFARQLSWLLLGVVVCLVVVIVDYHVYVDHASVLYGGMLFLLMAVLFFGEEVHGSRSWVRVGGLGFQPSEFAKLVVILALARYLAEINENYLRRRHLLVVLAMTLGPAVLVTLQGDLGTALTFFSIGLGMMLVAGVRTRLLITVLIIILLVTPLGWYALKDYQKQRILVTFDPGLDPQGVGYQTQQSLIAIGSGGLTGKGFGQGLQSQLGFVPEIHSDFIFALLVEESGFLGGTVILLLYLLGLMRVVRIAENARDRSGILIVTGVASLLCFHVAVNIGMTLGVMPAIGIPLPLLSYGGSFTLSCFIGLGLVLNVYRRRFVYSDEPIHLSRFAH